MTEAGTTFRRNAILNATTMAIAAFCVLLAGGCGTTKWSDTTRTGTEQLLISNAIDNSVSKIDFSPMSEKRIFLRTEAIMEATDNKYLALAIRQQIAASGGIICDIENEADYIVETRVGAIGTDRDDMLVGIPALTVPALPGANFSGTIPEIPFIKRTKQRAVAKIALFAYNKHTGRPVWASGNNQSESQARNLWFAGMGPLTRGTIYDGSTFAGHSVPEIIESKNDRRLRSFADHSTIYQELPNDPVLTMIPKTAPVPEKAAMKTATSLVPLPTSRSPIPTLLPPTIPTIPKYPEPILPR